MDGLDIKRQPVWWVGGSIVFFQMEDPFLSKPAKDASFVQLGRPRWKLE